MLEAVSGRQRTSSYAAHDASVDGRMVRVCTQGDSMERADAEGGYMMRRAAVTIKIGALAIIGLWALTVDSYAGRPLVTDDAYPVELGRVQVEAGLELETSSDGYTLTAPFSFGFGLTDWLEASIKPSVLMAEDQEGSPRKAVGVGDLVLAAKARLPWDPFELALALIPNLAIPTANENLGLGTGEVSGGVRAQP